MASAERRPPRADHEACALSLRTCEGAGLAETEGLSLWPRGDT